MSRSRIFVFALALLGCGGSQVRPAPPEVARAVTARDKAKLILEGGIGRANPDIVRALIGPHYRQHNPGVPDGPNGIIEMVEYIGTMPEPERPHPHLLRAIVDGDFVVIHAEYARAHGSNAGFDMFRVEDGKLAEHWDAGWPQPATTKNGHTMLDGPVDIVDVDKTQANKELVRRFADEVLVHRNVSNFGVFVRSGLVQHDPEIADGADAWKSALDGGWRYEAILRVLGEGNFVAVQSRGTIAGKLAVIYDLFRVDSNTIAEHWNVAEPIPDRSANSNGMF